MGAERLTNCTNCGAKLETKADGNIKCPYCGTEFATPAGSGRLMVDPSALPRERIANDNQSSTDDGSWSAWAVVFVVCLVMAIVVMTIIHGSNRSLSNAYADSVAIDTAAQHDRAQAAADSARDNRDTSANATLRELAAIKVDKDTFKKLYANARKKYDQFSGSTGIYDQSSPRSLGIKCVYVYIQKEGTDLRIRLKNQYNSTNGLSINSVIFNTDGENSTFSSWDFDHDVINGLICEWHDIDLTNGSVSTLVLIANAKKVIVKYEGSKYYDVVTITRAQQLAIKRELQIYKGLLLKYDKTATSKRNKGS